MSAGGPQPGISQQVTELCGGKLSPPRCLYFGVADLRDLLESTGGAFREVWIPHIGRNVHGESPGSPHHTRKRGRRKPPSRQKKEMTSGNHPFHLPADHLLYRQADIV